MLYCPFDIELVLNFKYFVRNGTRVLKKKKLKINVHRPVGTRVVFDDEGNTLPPLAKLAEVKSIPELVQLDKEKGKRFLHQMVILKD